MGRGVEIEAGGAARAFMRPLAMLAVGTAAGIVMWVMLMADDGSGLLGWQGTDHDGMLSTVLARFALIRP